MEFLNENFIHAIADAQNATSSVRKIQKMKFIFFSDVIDHWFLQ
jgi:hypothetical protein